MCKIDNFEGCVYLGQHYSLKENKQDKEIQRRIMANWAAFAKHLDIFRSNLAIYLKRHVNNSCMVPAMTYGAETWTLTKPTQNKLAAVQTKLKRSMLNITYEDSNTNIWVRERTKIIYIISNARKNEMVLGISTASKKIDVHRLSPLQRPHDKKRRQVRPAKRWIDDLDKFWSDTIWKRTAQNRLTWRRHAEAFAQPRHTTAAQWWWWWWYTGLTLQYAYTFKNRSRPSPSCSTLVIKSVEMSIFPAVLMNNILASKVALILWGNWKVIKIGLCTMTTSHVDVTIFILGLLLNIVWLKCHCFVNVNWIKISWEVWNITPVHSSIKGYILICVFICFFCLLLYMLFVDLEKAYDVTLFADDMFICEYSRGWACS